jgi:hypothetical protein
MVLTISPFGPHPRFWLLPDNIEYPVWFAISPQIILDGIFQRLEERKAVDYALNKRQAPYRYLEDARPSPGQQRRRAASILVLF